MEISEQMAALDRAAAAEISLNFTPYSHGRLKSNLLINSPDHPTDDVYAG